MADDVISHILQNEPAESQNKYENKLYSSDTNLTAYNKLQFCDTNFKYLVLYHSKQNLLGGQVQTNKQTGKFKSGIVVEWVNIILTMFLALICFFIAIVLVAKGDVAVTNNYKDSAIVLSVISFATAIVSLSFAIYMTLQRYKFPFVSLQIRLFAHYFGFLMNLVLSISTWAALENWNVIRQTGLASVYTLVNGIIFTIHFIAFIKLLEITTKSFKS